MINYLHQNARIMSVVIKSLHIAVFALFLNSACATIHQPKQMNATIEGVGFWDKPRRGANFFAGPLIPEWLTEARRVGIGWVRLTTANWPAAERDHLIGSADKYNGIPAADMDALVAQLDLAHAHKMPVVLTMLSLPGARWRQHNDDVNDPRLWTDPQFQDQTDQFFKALITRIGNHPALVAINPLNEPRLLKSNHINLFNNRVVFAIREIDPDLPIILDIGTDAEPETITHLQPIDDAHVIYAVHFYQPWDFITWRVNRGAYTYPGQDSRGIVINPAFIRDAFEPILQWQRTHKISNNRIVLAEFGIDRRIGGAAQYLADVVCVAQNQGWHWAFYAFRDWQAMDYELGSEPPPLGYWDALERGESPELARRQNPMFDTLEAALRGEFECPKNP